MKLVDTAKTGEFTYRIVMKGIMNTQIDFNYFVRNFILIASSFVELKKETTTQLWSNEQHTCRNTSTLSNIQRLYLVELHLGHFSGYSIYSFQICSCSEFVLNYFKVK